MKQPKLYQLLSTFSKKEIRAFLLFIQSPYFNQSPVLLHLFEAIKPYYPHFDAPRLTKQAIYKKLKLSSPFNEKFINDRFSDLSKLVEEFMVIYFVRNNDKIKQQVLRTTLNQHNLDHQFCKKTRTAIGLLEKKTDYSWEHSLELWKLKYDLFNHPQTLKWDCKKDEAAEMISHLDEAYIILKLRYGFHQKTRSTIFQKQEETFFWDTLIDYAKNSKHPVIKLYYFLLNTLEQDKLASNWTKAHNFYLQNFQDLPAEDQEAGLLGLINAGNKLAMSGNLEFYPTILELYKLGLNKNILLTDGVISEQTFKNIAMLGSGTGALGWTAKFIEEYEPRLPQNYDPNIPLICWAYYDFFSKDYNSCIDRLQGEEKLKMRDKIIYKSIELRCRYELYVIDRNTKELMDNLIDSYEQFLQRKRTALSQPIIKANQNFVYLTKSLSNLTHSPAMYRQAGKDKLWKEFQKRNTCVAKTWLLQKIESL